MADFSDSFSSTVTVTPSTGGITRPNLVSRTVTLTPTFLDERTVTLDDHVVSIRARFRAFSGYLATKRYRE
jgi:hypothetical protein